MTNGNAILDSVARRARALPLARIVAAMLGVSAAFFALAMPPRIVSGVLGLTGASATVGTAAQAVFAILFAALAATAGWLAITLLDRISAPAPVAAKAPWAQRKRPVAAKRADPAPTLRRGDAHPDAPPRRPIFAKNDLGTPFDEIVTDRRIVRATPETEFSTPDPATDLDATPAADPAADMDREPAPAPALEASAEVVATSLTEASAEPVPEPAAEPSAPIVAEPSAAIDEESLPEVSADPTPAPERRGEERPAAPREDDSIAALMARFEGGLGRLGEAPDAAAPGKPKRSGRHPDDALRDALAALQQMAGRQR